MGRQSPAQVAEDQAFSRELPPIQCGRQTQLQELPAPLWSELDRERNPRRSNPKAGSKGSAKGAVKLHNGRAVGAGF